MVKKGKTHVLSAEEARELIDSIDTDSAVSLRDRALIGIMVYTFARVGAVIKMRVASLYKYPDAEAVIILTPEPIRSFRLKGVQVYSINMSDKSLLMEGLS